MGTREGRRHLSTSLTAGKAAVPNVVGGQGSCFELADGRRVIDASNTAAPLGHGHPEIAEAVRAAASAPVVNEGWGWEAREEAAQDLIRIAFGDEDWVGAVRFFISASEANDAALALAQALTGRRDLATRERAYHGGAGLARELTIQPQWHGGLSAATGGVAAPPRLVNVHALRAPMGARVTGQPDPTAGDEWLSEAELQLSRSAAVILDYSQGGTYHSSRYRRRVWKKARETAGVEPLPPYDLRHAFASLQIRAGMSIPELAEQLGHSAQMTVMTYTHVIRELKGEPRISAEKQINRARRKARGPQVDPKADAGSA
jgi:4-aminobutyrate aminotransferase-like enzyme